jgi:hypothetical protein
LLINRNIDIDYEPEIKPALTWQMKVNARSISLFHANHDTHLLIDFRIPNQLSISLQMAK